MCANVIGSHPEVCITDEFLNVGMLNRLADQQISSFMKKRVEPDTLPLRKELLVKSYWLLRSSLKQIKKAKTSAVIGNKTPRAEHHYPMYEQIFSVNKPVYVYCARNAPDVLRSIKNLKNIQWSRLPFEEVFENYKRSFCVLRELKYKFSERVFVVNVDHYNRSELFGFYRDIFSSLGLQCDESTVEKINAMGPENTMQKVRRMIKDRSPIVELTESEIEAIESCSEYAMIKLELDFD